MPSTAELSLRHVALGKFDMSSRIMLAMLLLVWALAGVFGLQASGEPVTVQQVTFGISAANHANQLQLTAEQTEPVLLQSPAERQSAQSFLHPKQQPIFELAFAPTQQALLTLSLLLPVLVVLAWYIRAGPRRSFRLGLWHDANLCCKSQLYD